MRFSQLLPAVAALAAAPFATAQWSDGFESYAAGSPIEGQGGWHHWNAGPFPHNTVVGTTGPIVPATGNRMLRVIGDQINAVESDTVHELNGPYQLGSGQWTFKTMIYVPSGFFGSTFVIILDDYSYPAGPYDWAMQVQINGGTALVAEDTFVHPNFVITGGPQTILFDQWVEMRFEIDLANNTGASFYNNVEMTQFGWTAITASLDVLDALDLYPGTATVTEMYFDDMSFAVFNPPPTGLGTNYCGPAVPNTSGGPATLTATGSAVAANNNVTLTAANMPANQFGFFLTSMTQGFVPNPGGSNGNLCLAGTIGRYVAPGQIKNAGPGGTFSLVLPLPQTPAGGSFVPIVAGQTWNFQCWFRDIGPMGQPQSNFTNGRSIVFN